MALHFGQLLESDCQVSFDIKGPLDGGASVKSSQDKAERSKVRGTPLSPGPTWGTETGSRIVRAESGSFDSETESSQGSISFSVRQAKTFPGGRAQLQAPA